jgi:hypothetical protein
MEEELITKCKYPFFGPSFGVYTMVFCGKMPCFICNRLSESKNILNPFLNYPNWASVPACEEHNHLPQMVLDYQTQEKGLFQVSIKDVECKIPRSDGSISDGSVKWMQVKRTSIAPPPTGVAWHNTLKIDISLVVQWVEEDVIYEKGVKLVDFIEANSEISKIEIVFNPYLSEESKKGIKTEIKDSYAN